MSGKSICDQTVAKHGRLFHEYSLEASANLLPVDEVEEQRLNELDLQVRASFEIPVVIPETEPRHALDVGIGTGAWAERLKEMLEDVQIWGIDVYTGVFEDDAQSRIDSADAQSTSAESGPTKGTISEEELYSAKLKWDLNKTLRACDALFERGSNFRDVVRTRFDLVNMRCLTEGILEDRWPMLLRELWHLLVPGGWIQMVELDFGGIQSDSGRLSSDQGTDVQGLMKWIDCYQRSLAHFGRDRRISSQGHAAPLLSDQGYIDIEHRVIRANIGPWAGGDTRVQSERIQEMVDASLEPLCLHYAYDELNMHKEEFDKMVGQARSALSDSRLKLYLRCHTIIARRPSQQDITRSSSPADIKVLHFEFGSPTPFKVPLPM